MIELILFLAFEVLPNRTVIIEDKTMHSIVEHVDCRVGRKANVDEIMLRTEGDNPYCYVVQREPIMVKKGDKWEPTIERTSK